MSFEKGYLSDGVYQRILKELTHNQKFREEFWSNPQKALSDIGVNLTDDEFNTLKEIKIKKIIRNSNFDDRLILCSSAGF